MPGSSATESVTLQHYLASRRAWVEEALQRVLVAYPSSSAQLDAAIRYSLLNGGKRLRPVLVLACAEALPVDLAPLQLVERLLPFACALECIHTYSLLHDDLPAMDDDTLRRGRPTCHKQFDEATAILAGDALLTLAFELAAQPVVGIAAQDSLALIRQLAQGAGLAGMVGGQMLDMLAENRHVSLAELQTIHACKTGALLRVACVAGARLGGGNEEQVQRLTDYGAAIGLAFQITDDILDETGDSQVMGKAAGQDRKSAKATYPRLVGLREAQHEAEQQVERAVTCLEPFADKAEPLRQLARSLLTRTH